MVHVVETRSHNKCKNVTFFKKRNRIDMSFCDQVSKQCAQQTQDSQDKSTAESNKYQSGPAACTWLVTRE